MGTESQYRASIKIIKEIFIKRDLQESSSGELKTRGEIENDRKEDNGCKSERNVNARASTIG
jgi:hypothetical protein